MADLRGKQLPNLKISVDNTESTDESDDEVEVLDDKDVLIHDVAVEHSEQSEDDGETDKDDVEFNVRIGSFSDPKPQKPDRDGNLSEKIKSDIAKDDKRGSSEKRLLQMPVPEKRVYENKQGSFITGIDVISKEAQEKREERAKRFKIQQEGSEHSLDVQALFASLGVSEEDWNNQTGGLRGEAVHLRGTDEMSTKDVFDYFTEFPASGVEWINDTSCNVVWLDKMTSIRAMLKLSSSRDDVVAAEMKKKEERKKSEEEQKGREEKREKRGKDMEKEMEETHEEMEEVGAGDADKAKASKGEAAGQADCGDQSALAAGEEAMEVEDDELDLMADDETEVSSKSDKTDLNSDKPDPTIQNSEKADSTSPSTEDKSAADKKGGKKKTSAKKEGAQNEEKAAKKKKKERKEKKEGGKEKEDGEESDSSSSSSSSSGSSLGSSSGSSGSSSSGSDSSSSSDSNSSSSSESESEGERKKKKKKSPKAVKRDAETGEVAKSEQQRSRSRKEGGIVWPPGKWRLGVPCRKARYLFMRFATLDDKKEVGAEKKSQYYRKYGNPNYGGMKGLISSSRKRQIRQAKLDKELKTKGPDAREAIDRKREDRQRKRVEEEVPDREDGELSNEDDVGDTEEAESEGEESEGEVMLVEKPKDLRQLLNRDTSSPSQLSEDSALGKVVVKKRRRDDDDDEDEMDLDAELEQLMEPRPAKKRMMMRMRADEEEERIKAQRSRTGLLTVVASDRGASVHSRLAGRLGGRLQAPLAKGREASPRKGTEPRREGAHMWANEVRVLNSEEDDDGEEEEEEAQEMDDFARELESYRSLRNLPPSSTAKLFARSKQTPSKSSLAAKPAVVARPPPDAGRGDLRSRLGVPKQAGDSEKRKFPSMRIEVFDDDDE